jgi:ubiquinone/menaquinone biosynthesis C-methylase UbiE
MSEAEYIFTDSQFNSELERLRMLEAVSDRASHRRILSTGLTAGWRCLEVGAGAGSMMNWMSDQVGVSGKVVAVDVDTRFVENTSLSNVEVINADIRHIALANNSFDLIHARNILIHIADFPVALSRMLDLLKPNGWIALEEPDFSAARPIYGSEAESQAVTKVNKAICQMFSNKGLDSAFGIKLPSILQQLSLQSLQVENDVPLSEGGSNIATMMKMSARQLAEKYIATGEATGEDIEKYCQFAENKTSWGVYLAKVGVIAQKPKI